MNTETSAKRLQGTLDTFYHQVQPEDVVTVLHSLGDYTLLRNVLNDQEAILVARWLHGMADQFVGVMKEDM